MAETAGKYILGDGKKTGRDNDDINAQIEVLDEMLWDCLGAKEYNQRLRSLHIKSVKECDDISEKIYSLQRLVISDYDAYPAPVEYEERLEDIQHRITDMLAKRVVRERLNKELRRKIQKRQSEYLEDLKVEILKRYSGLETPETLRKYARLEKLEKRKLNRSMAEILRPSSIDEVVGQNRAISALIAKIASPYPQHVILYGPPGVGKTSAARLALEVAKTKGYSTFTSDADFIEVDGTTLRWDPREIANPLLGSVHDPIYQGSNRDLSEVGIPEPKIGLVTEAHGGVLFIDEIGEMDPALQNKLLKVMEDKRINFESIYYDSSSKAMPMYVKKVFEQGAPADFILIGATTRQPEEINPALRSRCTEVFFEPLTPSDIIKIVNNAVNKLGAKVEQGCAEIISHYTIEGRRAVNLLGDAYNYAVDAQGYGDGQVCITRQDVYRAIQTGRMSPFVKARDNNTRRIGRVLALGVMGYVGSLLEIEAIAFSASKAGQGVIRFNDTAGPMTKDSVFNAVSAIRKITGMDISNYDIHVNCIGGGRVDGPSAGMAIMTAMVSAVKQRPVRQDVAITGEISLQGYVKPVGGIIEKIYGARQNNMSAVIIPSENLKDVPSDLSGIEVFAVDRAEQALEILLDQ